MLERVLTVIQARTGSSRLPGKTLFPLGDSTVLHQMLRRVKKARLAGHVVVATTWESGDDILASACADYGVACFRGHPTDLLDRHYGAWKLNPAAAVVKIPSDCPLIDPKVIDRVIGFYLESADRYDFVSNLHPQSYPDGNDVEVMRAEALGRAWHEAKQPHEREHTTPYFWDNPEKFRIGNVLWEKGLDLSKTFRWTLDYREDYELIRGVFEALAPNGDFGVDEIVSLVENTPAVRRLNEAYLGEAWYNRQAGELKTMGL